MIRILVCPVKSNRNIKSLLILPPALIMSQQITLPSILETSRQQQSKEFIPSLPYDSVNLIFEYLSQLLDKKWKIVIDFQGRIRLRFNPYFSLNIHLQCHIWNKLHLVNDFQSGYTTLYIQYFPTEETMVVPALKQHRAVPSQLFLETRGENYGICYSYQNPDTNADEYVYVDTCYDSENQLDTLIHGTLFRKSGSRHNPYNVFDHEEYVNTNKSYIFVQNWTLDWFGNHDFEAAQTLLDLENNFEPLIEDIDEEEDQYSDNEYSEEYVSQILLDLELENNFAPIDELFSEEEYSDKEEDE